MNRLLHREDLQELDYSSLGLVAGLEIHQQLDTGKLFCRCPCTLVQNDVLNRRISRRLRFSQSETGEVDSAALHEFQIEVQDEIPGKRDGLISFAEEKLILEIHGNSGRISKNKARQLQDWVTEAELEQEMDDVTGLLIINHQCDLDPEERESEIPHNIKKFMKKRDYKLIRTKELFKMVKAYKMGNISSEEVKEKFLSADFEIKIEGVDL